MEVKLFGPVHAYVAPVTAGVVRFKAVPTQTGELLAALGVVGIAFTVAVVVPAALVQPLTVTVNEYTPDLAVVALVIDGF